MMVSKRKREIAVDALGSINECLGLIQNKVIEDAVRDKEFVNSVDFVNKNITEILNDIVIIGKLFDIEYNEISKRKRKCKECGRYYK